jgi:hypothetical protein
VEGNLGDPKTGLKLTILLSHLGIMVHGRLPLLKEASGVITIVGVRGVHR